MRGVVGVGSKRGVVGSGVSERGCRGRVYVVVCKGKGI